MAQQLKAGTAAIPHLRAWREYRLMSRAALAQAAKVTEPAIEKLEMGRAAGARFSTVGKLAKALHISPDELRFTMPPQNEAPAVTASERDEGAGTSLSTPSQGV